MHASRRFTQPALEPLDVPVDHSVMGQSEIAENPRSSLDLLDRPRERKSVTLQIRLKLRREARHDHSGNPGRATPAWARMPDANATRSWILHRNRPASVAVPEDHGFGRAVDGIIAVRQRVALSVCPAIRRLRE